MGFAQAVHWVTRDDGSDANGGGFDAVSGTPGTDFSNQAAAQIAYTDMVIGVTTTTFTSVGNPPAASLVGNIIKVTGGTGFTVQRVQVLSVTAGVATCDKSLGTAASTGGTGNMGGSLLTFPLLIANGATIAIDGNLLYYKGTFTLTTNFGMGLDSTQGTVGTRLIGFTTTPGDGGSATLTTATNSTNLVNTNGRQGLCWENWIWSNTAGTRAQGLRANSTAAGLWMFRNCVFDGFSVAIMNDANVDADVRHIQLQDVQIKNCTSHGIQTTGSMFCQGCRINSNTGDGVRCVPGGGFYMNFVATYSAFAFNSGAGVRVENGNDISSGPYVNLINCNLRDNGNSGFFSNVSSQGCFLNTWNTIYWNNTGYGINFTTNAVYGGTLPQSNFFGSNTTAARNNWPAGTGDVALTADPNTSASTGDFTLNNTAGGGAAVKAAGYQSSILG